MKTNQTLIGILGGVVVGTALGVLFAPDKGSKTRSKIIKKSTETTDHLKEGVGSILKSFSEKHNSIMNKGKELIEKEMNDIEIKNIKSINKQLGP